ncbi:MAG TPA: right-handed parallel beta-helix repeat-containing protein [Anaerohalosphaeraceae bacterium]|nr:right-handed parallel beta-helix repeat-containing protein [Anaerohalosphaeraceae bacterium]
MLRTLSIISSVFLSANVFCFGRTITVAPAGSGEFSSIQAAIDAAADGDEIAVAPGLYEEAVTFGGKAVRLYSTEGREVTTIYCDWVTAVVQCINGEGSGSILEGFKVSSSDENAKGLYVEDGGPTIRDCIFEGTMGCGLHIANRNGGNPTITNCIFHNTGAWGEWADVVIRDCVFQGNASGLDLMWRSYPVVSNCCFEDARMTNSEGADTVVTGCTFHGAGMENGNAHTIVTNCIFSFSSTSAIDFCYGDATISNCTFFGNRNGSESPGGAMSRCGHVIVTNSIFWDNGPQPIYSDLPGYPSLTITYSSVEGGYAGEGNTDECPLFVDPEGGDFRLQWYSPCIDAGNNGAVPAGVSTDLNGEPRFVDGNGDGSVLVDMGACEFQPQPSTSLGMSLQVTLEPQGAVEAGAAWHLKGEGAWRDSGVAATDLAPGYYEVEFSRLDGWFEPANLWVCVMRDVPQAKTATYRPVGSYAVGRIPPKAVSHGTTLAFYVYSEALGADAVLQMFAAPPPVGEIALDPATGLFAYSPDDEADVLPFNVTFTATSGGEVEQQAVEISPAADLPAETSLISRPMQAMPDDESRDYLIVNEALSETQEVFNGASRKVRSVTIAGKTVVFEAGHRSGLYEAYASPEGGPYILDIKEMNVYAETLIIRNTLHLPGTDLAVYARRLELDGADTHISTKPHDTRTIPPDQAAAGLDGGDIRLYIESCDSDLGATVRFRPGSTGGVNGGLPGQPGVVRYTPNESSPLAWLSPYGVNMAIAHTRDLYLYGYTTQAAQELGDYRELLNARMGLDSWDALDAQWHLEFEQMYGETVTLLHGLQGGLDYFGNPPGWTPMLSFEITKAFYEQEIDRAIRVLYLSYWVQNKAASIEQKAAALTRSREAVWDETQDFANQYAQVQALIPKLQSDAARITAQIGRADSGECSGLLCQLKQKEAELVDRADKIVKNLNQGPWWKGIVKSLTGIATSTISGAAGGGWGGAIMGAASGGLNLLTEEYLADEDTPILTNRMPVAKTFASIDFEEATGEWLDGFTDIPDDLNAVEQNGAAGYLQGLRSQAAKMAGGMYQIKESLKETSLSNDEVSAKLKEIKAADPIFNSLVDQITQLAVEKEVFNRQLTAAIQKVSTLANGITNNLLAIDGMNREASHLNRVLDARATMYVKDMERRARERLLKYHYYLAKSYEYRLLRPSPMNLNVGNMFTAMQSIVSADGTLSAADFEALKAVYEEQLWDLTDQIYRDYQDNKSYEATAPVRLELTAAQIADLNAGKAVVIDLKNTARFQYNEENTRIVDIEVETVDFHVEGTYDRRDYFDLEIEHAGVSRLQKDGEIYQFVHYKDVSRETSPINWNERHFADGYSQPVDRSEASESMLYSLLENCSHAGTGDIMLYARPGAWADIVIRKRPHEENSGDLMVDAVRLLVRYDRILRPVQYSTLQVATQPEELAPYFQVSREDRYGRRDGVGEFCRTYNSGTVNVTAPLQGGHYTFVKWTDGGGNEVTQNTALSVTLDTNLKRIAHYVYTGPMPSAADFNADFIVDYGDFVGLAEMWHSQQGDPKWDAAYDISDPADGVIDVGDLLRMAEEWLVVP